MNVSKRFIVLLLVAVVIFLVALYEFSGHVLFWAASAKTMMTKVGAQVTTRAFWESVPLVLGKWGSKSILKTLFFRIPMLVLNSILIMLLFNSKSRKGLMKRVVKAKFLASQKVQQVLDWFGRVFGVSGAASFVLSALAAGLMFFLTFTYLHGWGFFVWLGSWGPLAPVGTAVAGILSGLWSWVLVGTAWLANSLLYRVPYLGLVTAKCGEMWMSIIAPRLSNVEKHRRRLKYKALRTAYKSRQHNRRTYVRAQKHLRWRGQQARKRADARRLRQQTRFLWTSAARPLWERRFWRPDTLLQLKYQAPREAAERIHLRQMLGADVHQGLLHGGHSHWRVVRR